MVLRFGIILLGLMSCVLSSNLHAGSLPSTPPPKLRSAAVLVKDQRSGEFLMAKQADVAMPIASITKLMTAMVILDARLDLDEIITIQEADKDTSTQQPLAPADWHTAQSSRSLACFSYGFGKPCRPRLGPHLPRRHDGARPGDE